MSERIPQLSTAISIAGLMILSACATRQLAVVEKLDELNAVTITYSRTPFITSINMPIDRGAARDFVQIGAIEVNRMGTLQYYLWLGISDMMHAENVDKHPNGFESIVFVVGGEEFQLDVRGWTHEAIGAGEPIYEKLFRTSVDAYYQVSLEQIQLLTEADGINFRTTGLAPKEFVLWYRPIGAKNDLAEFFRTVSQ